jgi:hypothetical protein
MMLSLSVNTIPHHPERIQRREKVLMAKFPMERYVLCPKIHFHVYNSSQLADSLPMKTVAERKRKKSMNRQSQHRHRHPVNETCVSTTEGSTLDSDAPALKRARVTIEEVTDEGDNSSDSVPSTRTKYVSSKSPPFLVLSHLEQG